MRKLIKLIINSIIGILILFLINQIGATWNFHIGINIFTALFVRDFRSTRSNIIGDIKTNHVEDKLEFVSEIIILRISPNLVGDNIFSFLLAARKEKYITCVGLCIPNCRVVARRGSTFLLCELANKKKMSYPDRDATDVSRNLEDKFKFIFQILYYNLLIKYLF